MLKQSIIGLVLLVLCACDLDSGGNGGSQNSSSVSSSSAPLSSSSSFHVTVQRDTLMYALDSVRSIRKITVLGYGLTADTTRPMILDSVKRIDTVKSVIRDSVASPRGFVFHNRFGTTLRLEAYLGRGNLWYQNGQVMGTEVSRLILSQSRVSADSSIRVFYPATAYADQTILWVLGLEKGGQLSYLVSWSDKLFPIQGMSFVVNPEAEISKVLD